jgi:acetyltransferase
MNNHTLDKLFNPSSIAIIGASERANSVGMKVFNNVLRAGFKGSIYPVNPKHKIIMEKHAFTRVKDINQPIDLAIITTPAKTIPDIIEECGKAKVNSAVIISAGFSEMGKEGKALEQSILKFAQQYKLRLIGPNCLGIMRPHLQLNATFDSNFVLPGNIALISQSGAICAAILDWAAGKQVGFSATVSLGNAADLDFDELLDFFVQDAKTESILLYIEGIHHPQKFMASLRMATNKKPIIVIKGGRYDQGMRAAHSHTGALVGGDDVFDAALRQNGAIRVMTIKQLFSATAILSCNYRTKGNRLIIITNGGGAGVMAADRASELHIDLPKLSEETLHELNNILPKEWSHQNPVDILGDATPQRYHQAINICAKDESIDGILTILIPVAMSNPLKVAQQVISDNKNVNKPIMMCWMGDKHVNSSRELFAEHKIPCFNTPEEAIEAFSYLADYQYDQEQLHKITPSLKTRVEPDLKKINQMIMSARKEKRTILTAPESKTILKAFGIPITEPMEADSAERAVHIAKDLKFPVVMKINSPDISHKKEANGVKLNIQNVQEVQETFKQLIQDAKKFYPHANILGVTIEKMAVNDNNRELMIGVISDKVFGHAITFGMGGSLVEVIHDRAIALPPLNSLIIKHLIARTRASKLLGKFRNMAPANLEALTEALLRVSDMLSMLPCIQEMDINPLMLNDKEIFAVDARIILENMND